MHVHTFTNTENTPHVPVGEGFDTRSPTEESFRSRRPDPPIGAFPVGSSVLR